MKKVMMSLLLALTVMTAGAQQVTVQVKNNTAQQRQEVVEVDAQAVYQRLGVAAGRNFRVINAVRQEVIYQITHDGKILIDASVRPHGTATYTIVKGQPRDVKVFVCGRQYPERVDDIAWENDRGAYRLYGPALQKSGERAFGNDVWVKNTPDLEVEKRYKVELDNHPAIQKLKKQGKEEEALALEELAGVIPAAQDVERQIELKELSDVVREFLDTLEETESQVFLSRYWYMAPVGEIAEKFGFTRSKTASMLRRTRERLIKYLREEGLC